MNKKVIIDKCIESYSRLKNLKLVGLEVGIPWQTVYVYLKQAGISVTGDKSRYGSATDRVAVIGEQRFRQAVPFATDNNGSKFQYYYVSQSPGNHWRYGNVSIFTTT